MMKRLLLVAAILVAGCNERPTNPHHPAIEISGWEFVGYGPDGVGYLNGIYKQHNDKEKVTIYAAHVREGWSISVVKD